MSIVINKEKCIGCRRCQHICPGNLIKSGEERKAYIKYPKDCWGCCSCLKECDQGAISLYLGADMGGMGSRLSAEIQGNIVLWKVQEPGGELSVIEVNRKDSNQY